jgi:hypothetical protein
MTVTGTPSISLGTGYNLSEELKKSPSTQSINQGNGKEKNNNAIIQSQNADVSGLLQQQDTITIGATSDEVAGIYSKDVATAPKTAPTVEELWAENTQRMNQFNEFVQKMLQNQGTSSEISNFNPNAAKNANPNALKNANENSALFDPKTGLTTVSFFAPKFDENGNVFGEKMTVNATAEDIEKAKKSIEEGGEYSVDKVAGRIMDMANALAKGDDSKIGILRNAVMGAFSYVKGLYGDDTPDITNKTYDKVMGQFDAWQADADKRAAETMENTAKSETLTQSAMNN